MSMAKSNAIAGVGTVFGRWDIVTAAFVPVAEVISIGGPSKTRETIEVTHLTSPDGYKEYISGLRDGGTVPLSMNFTPENYEVIDDDFHDDELVSYQIEFPDGTVFELEGFVTDLSVSAETADKITVECTIQVSGKIMVELSS